MPATFVCKSLKGGEVPRREAPLEPRDLWTSKIDCLLTVDLGPHPPTASYLAVAASDRPQTRYTACLYLKKNVANLPVAGPQCVIGRVK